MTMAVWNLFKKRQDPRLNHILDDEDRRNSIEMRRLNMEIKKQQAELAIEREKLLMEKEKLKSSLEIEKLKAEIDALHGDDEDILEDEEDPMNKMLMMMAMQMLNKNNTNTVSPVQPSPSPLHTPPEQVKQSFSDDELKDVWNNTPSIAKSMAKKMNDDTIKAMIIQKMPNIDDDTIQRAIKIVRSS